MITPVSFELAKLLTEKGIIFETEERYSSETKVTSVSYNEFPAPTIAEVVMWLYEKHGIWISVYMVGENEFHWETEFNGEEFGSTYSNPLREVTEAYGNAIEFVLKKLLYI